MPFTPQIVANNSTSKSGGGTSTLGDDGGTYAAMDNRLTALETHFEYVRRDMDALKSGQAETNHALAETHRVLADVSAGLVRVSSQMQTDKAEIRADIATLRAETAKMPTMSDLQSWKLQWTAIGFAMIALIIGGVIGGLGWLATVIPPG